MTSIARPVMGYGSPVENVEGNDGRDIAGAENEGNLPLVIRVAIEAGGLARQLIALHARLHPDIHGVAVKQESLIDIRRINPGHGLTIRLFARYYDS